MADAVETPGTTTEAAAVPAADPLAAPTILATAQPEAKPEGGDPAPEAEKPAEDAKPTIPETYELKAPEGLTLDPESVALATPVFKELNLDNEQAQKLIPVAAEFAKRVQAAGQTQMQSEVAAIRADWAKKSQEDPEIGGAKLDETKALAAKAMDGLQLPPEFRAFLGETGLANHPEMIRMLRRVGTAISEDSFHRGTSAAAKPSTQEIMYPNDVRKGA